MLKKILLLLSFAMISNAYGMENKVTFPVVRNASTDSPQEYGEAQNNQILFWAFVPKDIKPARLLKDLVDLKNCCDMANANR